MNGYLRICRNKVTRRFFSTVERGSPSRLNLPDGPGLKHFLQEKKFQQEQIRSNPEKVISSQVGLKYYIETYGCQMNVSDSEIVSSLLNSAGHVSCAEPESADLILTNTCAIRENAESKVWRRLQYFQSIRKKNRSKGHKKQLYPLVGVLGCMAERLKDRLLLEESVDFVCGPDAYRDVPRLIDNIISAGQKQANTMLSFEETYADIHPVRQIGTTSAFVSIMRGCNNMCSFCIVPFTRGRERSRPMSSIIAEVEELSKQGVKELVLLGQNVNGYHDASEDSAKRFPTTIYESTPGFNNLYRSKKRDMPGARFPDLLAAVSEINPEMRIRFTSPHPKDFPERVLEIISERSNICKSLHLPLQSGSSNVLQRMRRGYTREAFLDLVRSARKIIPDVSISTDIISGFCGELEEDHNDTLSLMEEVKFDQAFMFAYSLRERTHAAHNLQDDVPESVKQKRLEEVIDKFHTVVREKNQKEEFGSLRLVLVEGESTKSTIERPTLTGRTDGNKRVVFPATPSLELNMLNSLEIESRSYSSFNEELTSLKRSLKLDVAALGEEERQKLLISGTQPLLHSSLSSLLVPPTDLHGRYAVVQILKADSSTLRGILLGATSLQAFSSSDLRNVLQ